MFNEYIADDIIVSLYKKKTKKQKKTARQNEIAQSVIYNKNAQKFKNQNENALPVAINCGALVTR